MGRTHYYLLTEDGSSLGNLLGSAFEAFEGTHHDDAAVHRFVRNVDSARFERARQAFDVRRIPAVVISDEAHAFDRDEPGNPSIALDRGILEKHLVRVDNTIAREASHDSLYHLLADFHYVVKDENLLHLRRKLAVDRVGTFLRAAWEEIKDLVSVNVAP